MIGIFSLERDLHAYAVLEHLEQRGEPAAHFFPTDSMARSGGLRWCSDGTAQLFSSEGRWIPVNELDVVWWRRANQSQDFADIVVSEDLAQLVSNEWRASLSGTMLCSFDGVWVNKPHCDARAGNKLFQLMEARKAGFRVPETLVSDDPIVVRDFITRNDGRVIAKKILGAAPRPLATILMHQDDLEDSSISSCPTMYQEYISGDQHVRAHVFGGQAICALISSDIVDWRRDLNVPFAPHELHEHPKRMLSDLLDALGLEMGIFDLKYTTEGELVWIELNTQGQFLFCEALADIPLSREFASFLINLH